MQQCGLPCSEPVERNSSNQPILSADAASSTQQPQETKLCPEENRRQILYQAQENFPSLPAANNPSSSAAATTTDEESGIADLILYIKTYYIHTTTIPIPNSLKVKRNGVKYQSFLHAAMDGQLQCLSEKEKHKIVREWRFRCAKLGTRESRKEILESGIRTHTHTFFLLSNV